MVNVLVMPSLSASGKYIHIKRPRPSLSSPRDLGAYTERSTCHDRDMHHQSEG